MRDVPQLKLVREDHGWSQRDLAARSGVAPNTISQLERGERKAMPSTVRKLAAALGVEAPVLLADPHKPYLNEVIEELSGIQQAIGLHPGSEEASLSVSKTKRYFEKMLTELGDTTPEASRQPEAPRDRGSQPSPQPRTTSALERISKEFHKEAARVRKEWYETGRGAEFYVSGELAKRVRAFGETHDVASIRSEGHPYDFSLDPEQSEQTYLKNIRTAPRSHKADPVGDPVAVRSRLFSDDPKETVIAAQLVLNKAKRIVEEHEGYLQSFRRIPERYYAEPQAHSRILKLEEALSKQREAAAEDIQKLMDLYDECLDALEDQILGMRKESDALEEFVTQAHDSEG
jgi:transcriptional regulator with XRE-family HTH domain